MANKRVKDLRDHVPSGSSDSRYILVDSAGGGVGKKDLGEVESTLSIPADGGLTPVQITPYRGSSKHLLKKTGASIGLLLSTNAAAMLRTGPDTQGNKPAQKAQVIAWGANDSEMGYVELLEIISAGGPGNVFDSQTAKLFIVNTPAGINVECYPKDRQGNDVSLRGFLVPRYDSSADTGKVLSVKSDGSGIEWAAQQGGGVGGDNVLVVDVFINSYASTITGGNKTYAEIKAAFDAGKFVVVRAQDTISANPEFDPSADTEIYVLDYYNNESDIFEFACSGMTFRGIRGTDPLYGNNKKVNFSKKLLTLWKRDSQGQTNDTWRLYNFSQQPPQAQFFNFEITETSENVWQSIDPQYYSDLRTAYEQGSLVRFKITRSSGIVIYDPQVSFTEHTIHLTFPSGYTSVSFKVVDIAEDGTVSTHIN